MKTILKLILLFVLSISQAQQIVDISQYNKIDKNNTYFKDLDNHYSTFIGIWEANTNNNITFRLILWKVNRFAHPIYENSFMDRIKGKFLIIENAHTPNQRIICNSVKYFRQSRYTSEYVINTIAGSSKGFGSTFEDTCASGGSLKGFLSFKIIDNNASPLQAEWKIKHGYIPSGQAFAVPKNIVLTKVD